MFLDCSRCGRGFHVGRLPDGKPAEAPLCYPCWRVVHGLEGGFMVERPPVAQPSVKTEG